MERIELSVDRIEPWQYFKLLVKLRLRRVGWLYALFCAIGLFQLTSSSMDHSVDHLGFLLLSLPLVMVGVLWYWAYRMDNRAMLEARHFTLDPDKLVGTTQDGSRGEIPWNRIQRVLEIDAKVLLYVSAGQMIILPRSAFLDIADLTRVKSWVQASKKE
ncbi:MAG: YcxB family protein [Flavobacteriales bacterium]|nr:YcxB family protein [Flavobacteriales bacterium]